MPAAPTLADFVSQRYAAGGHFVTRLLSQRLGAWLAWLALQARLSPNAVTLAGAGVFLAGAWLFASRPPGAGAVLACLAVFQLGYGIDCADGQLARATGRTSPFGAWLDVACDYARNVFLGVAVAAWLAASGIELRTALVLGATFTTGAAVQLHTVTAMRQADREDRLQTAGLASRLRVLVTTLLDTAAVLLVLPLLRPWPLLLGTYVAAVGLAYLGMATLQARRRLRPKSGP